MNGEREALIDVLRAAINEWREFPISDAVPYLDHIAARLLSAGYAAAGAKPMRRGRRMKEVTIRGVTYPSRAEAARSLGVDKAVVIRACQTGRLDFVGLGVGSNPKSHVQKGQRIGSKPITIQGVTYPSQRIAAEVLGVAQSNISGAKKRGRLDFVGLGRSGWNK